MFASHLLSNNVYTFFIYVCSVTVLQFVIKAFGTSIWKKHLGDVYIVRMIV